VTRRGTSRVGSLRKGVQSYSLWTAPPQAWSSPIESELPTADLETKVSELELTKTEDNEQTKAFRTPVTPDVLSRPTQD
jgi:hypothetical protein